MAGDTEPEPDPVLFIFEGDNDDYADAHPTAAKLVIEVSVTTVEYDRIEESKTYSAGGVEEYWLIDVCERQLEVYRRSTPARRATPNRSR